MYFPHRLTFLTTNTCTARCGHCSVSSSPDRKGRLTFDQMRETIDGVRKKGPLHTVVWAGGEPTLLGQDLLDAIAYAFSLGINTRVVTNVSWAISPQKARQKLVSLREAGLRELNISADDYHLPYIPFDNVAHAWREAHGEGFDTVLIAIAHGPRSLVTPQWVAEQLNEAALEPITADTAFGETRLRKVLGGTAYIVYGTYLQKLGRSHDEVPAEDFQQVPWEQLQGGCPFAASSPAVSPDNNLLACCGFEVAGNAVLDFGDLDTHSVPDLYAHVERDLIVKAIAERGPAFLADFVSRKAPHISWRPTYSSVCEVCEHVTTRQEVVDVLKTHSDELAAELILFGPMQKAEMGA